MRLKWSLASLALDYQYATVREDLRKLSRSKNAEDVTELAAQGTAFALVTVLLPKDKITKVVQKGGYGDFYLNGRRDQMIEISGTLAGDLDRRFREKTNQVLRNTSLARALVGVSRFQTPASRLEQVK